MKYKSAFSLIEVLMVMGIIAVITVMGLSISKKNVERAYNLYWYTGYNALVNTTIDAIAKHHMDPDNPSGSLEAYTKYIGEYLMNAKNYDSSTHSFTAPNGINYKFESKSGFYQITMSVPKHKQKNMSQYQTIFIYNFAKSMIYPANISNPTDIQLNLHNRVDLLPFYIKKGATMNTNEFLSFHDAYCRVYESINNLDTIANISCSNAPTESGYITPISPRKAF